MCTASGKRACSDHDCQLVFHLTLLSWSSRIAAKGVGGDAVPCSEILLPDDRWREVS